MSGFFTPGFPVSTILTGNETIPADTNLNAGGNPETIKITTSQLSSFAVQNRLYTINYLSWPGAVEGSGQNATTALQNFLLYCQLQAYQLPVNDVTLNDQNQRLWVNAYLPRGIYQVLCPIIIPEYVNLISDGLIVRDGHINAVNPNFYNGDTTSTACGNFFQPTVIGVLGAGIETINLYCNSNGQDNGSGLFCGKNWNINGASPANPGVGYHVGDVLTLPQPSKQPYIAPTLTVSSVSGIGGILSVSVTNQGAYALPPVLQTQQWTAANGFTNGIANQNVGQVFDQFGNYICSGGNGTGATFQLSYVPDWSLGSSTYNSGSTSTLIGDMVLDTIRVQGCGVSFNSTYGSMYAFWPSYLNYEVGRVETGGGNIGVYLRGTGDFRANSLNPVDAETGLGVFAAGSVECPNVVIDTPSYTFFTIDQVNSAILRIHCLNMPGTASLTSGFGAIIGEQSANSGLDIDATFDATTGLFSSPVPLISVQNTKGSRIRTSWTQFNRDGSRSGVYIAPLLSFGSGVDVSNVFEGRVDTVITSLFTGTIPHSGMNIWDSDCPIFTATSTATITGSATNGDTIILTFTNLGLSTLPHSVTTAVTTGQTTTQIATAIKNALNADSTLVALNITATSSTNVVTIVEPGSIGNNTIITSAVTGGATEIVTLTSMSGGVSGGYATTSGLYQIIGAGVPVSSTGLNKALGGSTYIDSTNNNFYLNKGTSTLTNWTLQGGGGSGSPGGSSGQVQYNSAGSFGGFTVSGDGTLVTSTGVLTVTKTNGTSFASSATTDTTNATNITSGTLPAAQLPNPSATTLGGVESIAAVAHNFLTGISTSGVPSKAQPAFTDISGTASNAQIPTPTTSALGGIEAVSGVTSNQFMTYVDTSGIQHTSQPAFSNLSGTLGAQIPSGTYASKPSAASAQLYYATDLGTNGILLISNGTIWKPAGGSGVIYQNGNLSGLATSSTSEINLFSVTIPAGLLSVNGALRLTIQGYASGANNTKDTILRWGTSAGVNGSTIGSWAMTSAQFSYLVLRTIWNVNSLSSQTTAQNTNFGAAVSTSLLSTSVNTANTTYLNFDANVVNAGDTAGFGAVTIEWMEP